MLRSLQVVTKLSTVRVRAKKFWDYYDDSANHSNSWVITCKLSKLAYTVLSLTIG